nr:putative zinc finger, CCHC-type [Tanacetum cinerariifolium]
MNVEMQSMKDNEVWVFVELPPNGKTVGSKWLFKKKTDMDGNVHIYKARLVAKGYTQTQWIDYDETFSPVADIKAIMILIAIATYYDYEIWQMDVKTTFLNGYLNEERYCMENSKRGSTPMQEKLKLSKSQGAFTPAELKRMQNVSYASAVGSIMYAVRCTRPDVAFAQNVTSRFQQNQCDLKRELRVSCYTDAGYLTDADDLKSQTGYVAIAIANESGITKGARHFRAKVHYLREVIEFSDIKLEKVHTDDNLADPFTKALAFPKHSEHTRNIGMLPASSLM